MSTKTPPAHKGHQIRHHEQSRKETIHLNQRNHPRDNPTTHHTGRPPSHPADEVKLGIDFWHAVEFSRSGRTPTNRLSAARRGNPSSLGSAAVPVKFHEVEGPATPRPSCGRTRQAVGSTEPGRRLFPQTSGQSPGDSAGHARIASANARTEHRHSRRSRPLRALAGRASLDSG
jgi:hypothetical protein